MKTSISKKIGSLFLAVAIALTTVFAGVTTVKADADIVFGTEASYAAAGVEQRFDFTMSAGKQLAVYICTDQQVKAKITVYNAAGNAMNWKDNPIYISEGDWTLNSSGVYEYYDLLGEMSSGDYTYGITFERDVNYAVVAASAKGSAKISQKKATITAGFSKKLSVSGGKVKTWKSDKKSVATVNSKGKVTAKKAGKAHITAVLTDGQKLKCTVTVKKNQYTERKATTSDFSYGQTGMGVYKAYFDSHGNLVIKTVYVNNTSHKTSYFKNLKIVVKDADGKKVGVYKAGKKTVNVPSYSTKGFTFVIKKSQLNKKKADLRNGKITASGTSYYTYYY